MKTTKKQAEMKKSYLVNSHIIKLGSAKTLTLGPGGPSFEFTGRPARRAYLR